MRSMRRRTLLALAAAVASLGHAKPADTSEGCSAENRGRSRLRTLWCSYAEAPVLDRWLETADAYEQHLPAPGSLPQLKMLEIGVQSGGSTRSWRQHYGSSLYYVGVDLNAGCVRSARAEETTFIEIGSQTNASFLLDVCERHGPFDVVIDDGGHTTGTIRTSIRTIFASSSCMKGKSLYVVEDMHTMHYSGHVKHPQQLYSLVGEGFWSMHYAYPSTNPNRYGAGNRMHPIFKDRLVGVHGYPTIAFFAHGRIAGKLSHLIRGTDHLKDSTGFNQG